MTQLDPDREKPQAQEGPGAARASGMISGPSPQPLYRQVKSHLVDRVLAGEWRPGESLPSEMKLADEYGLSQGTVRKAIEEMAAEGLVSRKAGRGTFVTSHGGDRRPFRFHRLRADDGQKIAGDNVEFLHCLDRAADPRAAAGLGLPPNAMVTETLRLRHYGGAPVLVERICLSTARFPGIGAALESERPASIYLLLERLNNVLVTRVEERVRARMPTKEETQLLALRADTPVLEVERVAFSLANEPVEWRTMTCATDDVHYSGSSSD